MLELLEHHDPRHVCGFGQGGAQQGMPAGEHHHQIDARVIDQPGHLAAAVVRIDWHAAHSQRVERQLVQQVFGPVFEQQADAVTAAVARIRITLHQHTHCGGSGLETDLETLRVIGPRSIGGHGQQGIGAIARGRPEQGVADGGVVVDLDHAIP